MALSVAPAQAADGAADEEGGRRPGPPTAGVTPAPTAASALTPAAGGAAPPSGCSVSIGTSPPAAAGSDAVKP